MALKKIYTFPTEVFVSAFSTTTRENKNKGKRQRVKTDDASFSLAPSFWKRQHAALYLGFQSAVLFVTCKIMSSLGESERSSIFLTAFSARTQKMGQSEAFTDKVLRVDSCDQAEGKSLEQSVVSIFTHSSSPPLFFSGEQSCGTIHAGSWMESRKGRLVIGYVILCLKWSSGLGHIIENVCKYGAQIFRGLILKTNFSCV